MPTYKVTQDAQGNLYITLYDQQGNELGLLEVDRTGTVTVDQPETTAFVQALEKMVF